MSIASKADWDGSDDRNIARVLHFSAINLSVKSSHPGIFARLLVFCAADYRLASAASR
jgi:hypothetical protein